MRQIPIEVTTRIYKNKEYNWILIKVETTVKSEVVDTQLLIIELGTGDPVTVDDVWDYEWEE